MSGIEGLFFDQDGVIVDTERDGHRVAFNLAFAEIGIPVTWDVERYHTLLQIAGGKERMRHHFEETGWAGFPPGDRDEIIRNLHRRKTEIFIELIESGRLPLRPGIHRVMSEANTAGVTIAICTTSDERAAAAVRRTLLGDIVISAVLAGDVVSRKKPDPEIYELALTRTGLRPESVVVIEDSYNGVTAAKAAGLRVIATTNPYTERENLSAADIVVTSLAEVSLSDIMRMFGS